MRGGRCKLHSLQSVWTSRRLPEGGPTTSLTNNPHDLFETLYSLDPHLNAKITHLHILARQGAVENIQQHIDAYLPAVAYHNQTASPLACQMVLSITDAPQLGTLPDLGPVIRGMLTQSEVAWGFILSPLSAALPCIVSRKPPNTAQEPTDDTHQVALCILLALLLGVYPTSVKFPPFHIRVALYRRIHCLLTHGTGIAFCRKHPALLTLALMEYCSYVLPAYLPVEYNLLAGEGVEGLFSMCPLQCDAFRQEVLITGEEAWAVLEDYCVPLVERYTRTCKSKSSHAVSQDVTATTPSRRQQEQFQSVKLCPAALQHLPGMPILVPYSIHLDDPTHKIMGSEMRFLGLVPQNPHANYQLEQAVALQRAMHVKPLPPNLTQIQIRSLSGRMRECERSALSGSILYACMHCIMGGQQAIHRKGKPFPTRGQCKLQLGTPKDDLICSICHNHSILSISALGRIISLKNHQFYLAPCCCSVQPYLGRGDEFTLDTTQHCHHKRPAKPASKNTKRRCELCANVALVDAHQAVDHLTGELHTAYLCQRHTPHEDALRHVVNWSQLQEEIRKRDTPLFFHRRLKGRRGGDNE